MLPSMAVSVNSIIPHLNLSTLCQKALYIYSLGNVVTPAAELPFVNLKLFCTVFMFRNFHRHRQLKYTSCREPKGSHSSYCSGFA